MMRTIHVRRGTLRLSFEQKKLSDRVRTMMGELQRARNWLQASILYSHLCQIIRDGLATRIILAYEENQKWETFAFDGYAKKLLSLVGERSQSEIIAHLMVIQMILRIGLIA